MKVVGFRFGGVNLEWMEFLCSDARGIFSTVSFFFRSWESTIREREFVHASGRFLLDLLPTCTVAVGWRIFGGRFDDGGLKVGKAIRGAGGVSHD